MRLPYTAKIHDELLEFDILTDIECELDVDILNRRDMRLEVTAVRIEGRNLFAGGPFARRLATEIIDRANEEINRFGTRIRERAVAEVEMEAA